MLAEVTFIIGAYLLGSLPVLSWIGSARGFDMNLDEDLHQVLWREVGYAEGLAGVLWDVIKGPVPPLLAWWYDFDILVIGLSGLAVTAGQMWPVFTQFYGKERGNTTGLGAALGIAPLTLGFALIPVAIGGGIRVISSLTRAGKTTAERFKLPGMSDSMPLGMLAAFAALPLIAWRLDEDATIIWIFVALFAMIIFRRLTADLTRDLASVPRPNIAPVLMNRFLYDRSYH